MRNANSEIEELRRAVFLKTCPEADTELEHGAGCRQEETERRMGGVGKCRREEEVERGRESNERESSMCVFH